MIFERNHAIMVDLIEMHKTDSFERQDLSCMYLARHELESAIIVITIIIVIIVIIIIIIIIIVIHAGWQ